MNSSLPTTMLTIYLASSKASLYSREAVIDVLPLLVSGPGVLFLKELVAFIQTIFSRTDIEFFKLGRSAVVHCIYYPGQFFILKCRAFQFFKYIFVNIEIQYLNTCIFIVVNIEPEQVQDKRAWPDPFVDLHNNNLPSCCCKIAERSVYCL